MGHFVSAFIFSWYIIQLPAQWLSISCIGMVNTSQRFREYINLKSNILIWSQIFHKELFNAITITPSERHVMLIVEPPNVCLKPFRLNKNNTKTLWNRESTGDRWIPAQRAYNAESVYMSWRHPAVCIDIQVLLGRSPSTRLKETRELHFGCQININRVSQNKMYTWQTIGIGRSTAVEINYLE